MHGVQQVMMVVPVNPDIDEAEAVVQEYGHQIMQRREGVAMGYMQLQHHDGDDDSKHTIAEGFQP